MHGASFRREVCYTHRRAAPGRVESLADENGKKFPGYVADMTTWIGLQVVNRHSGVRIKNFGTNVGEGMTDDLAFEALATARRASGTPTNGHTLAEPWKATSPRASLPITAS